MIDRDWENFRLWRNLIYIQVNSLKVVPLRCVHHLRSYRDHEAVTEA